MTVRNTALKSGTHITWTQYKTANAPLRRPGTHRLVLGTRPRQERHLGPPRPARTRRARRHQGLPHRALSEAHTPRQSPTTTTSRRTRHEHQRRGRRHRPRTRTRPGAGGNSRRRAITWAELPRLGTPARPHRHLRAPRSGCAAASTPSTWPAARPPRSRQRHRAGRGAARRVRQPPRNASARPALRSTSATPASSSCAGLAGGKGVPESVAAHPCVFATLTAPSFGPVHARRKRGKTVLPCRPRRDANDRRCPHGRDISCPVRHAESDPRLGRPLCGDCYDYEAAVLFNLHAADLWRRFTTYLPRHLARLAGVTRKRLRAELAIRFVKVAEYQARGVVHFHAVIRLDAPGTGYTLPPPRYTAALLCDAITLAARTVRLVVPAGHIDPATGKGRVSGCASAANSTSAPSGASHSPRPAQCWTPKPSPTTSPSTPPKPPTSPACPTPASGTPRKSPRCAARPTTSAWSPPRGC